MSVDPSELSDTIPLAQRAANGDELAFEELFGRFRDHLKRFIELRLDDRIRARVDPSDVLQETQIEIHRRLREFLDRDPMPFRIWLRVTAKERLIAAREKHLNAAKRSVSRGSVLQRSR